MQIALDPLISNIHQTCKTKKKDLFEETKNLFDYQIMEEVEDVYADISNKENNFDEDN